MASIVFTAINTRSLANWSPVLRELEGRGHEVRSLLFPHCADPDSAGLEDAANWCRPAGVFPLRESLWGAAPGTWGSVVAQALEPLRSIGPDAVLMTACHAGPEPELAVAWSGDGRRPVFIGCQHGFVQNWEGYWSNFCFDHLLVFGQTFRQLAPSRVAERVHVAGLAKLDAIVTVPRPAFADDRRPILFAGQRTCTEELTAVLRTLADVTRREILVRPHPEHRDAVRATGMPLVDHHEPIAAQIDRCSLVVTTGSTVVLEAIAAGAPVAVLPVERGELYADAGVVARGMNAADVLAVVEAQAADVSRARVREFLVRATGAEKGGRVAMGADVIERLCGAGKA
jgi:hypothetical protein